MISYNVEKRTLYDTMVFDTQLYNTFYIQHYIIQKYLIHIGMIQGLDVSINCLKAIRGTTVYVKGRLEPTSFDLTTRLGREHIKYMYRDNR